MPRIKTILTATAILASVQIAGAQSIETAALTATVEDVRNSTGSLIIAAFNEADAFEAMDVANAAAMAVVPATQGEVSITFHDLPTGRYAVAAMHDENLNLELDQEDDVPTEGYGFVAMGPSGLPPRFEDAAKTVEQSATSSLTLRYWN
jgi:uncharacterized protein (DUF2141 family)